MLLYSSLLLSAADVLKLPGPAQTAYLICAWGVAYLGVVAVYQIVAMAATIALVEDKPRENNYMEMKGPPDLPLFLTVGGAMPAFLAVLVLQHVTSHLRPSHLRDAAARPAD